VITKEVSRAALWHLDLTNTLLGAGYKAHPLIKCFYYKQWKDKYSLVMIHVDDLAVSSYEEERRFLHELLTNKYGDMKTQSGAKTTYIGMQLYHTNNTFECTMSKKIESLMEKFGIVPDINILNPASSTFIKDISSPGDSCNETEFRSLVMSLRWIASLVCPETLFHISYLATKQSKPTKIDFKAGLRVLQYINNVKDVPFIISDIGDETPTIINVYTDASRNIHLDGKSHSGCIVFVGNNRSAVCNFSNKQHCMSNSSCDAELIAWSDKMYIGQFYSEALKIFNISSRVIYHQDNQGARDLVTTGTNNLAGKGKYIVSRINTLKEYFDNEENNSCHVQCSTIEMKADMDTKPLYGTVFETQRNDAKGVSKQEND